MRRVCYFPVPLTRKDSVWVVHVYCVVILHRGSRGNCDSTQRLKAWETSVSAVGGELRG